MNLGPPDFKSSALNNLANPASKLVSWKPSKGMTIKTTSYKDRHSTDKNYKYGGSVNDRELIYNANSRSLIRRLHFRLQELGFESSIPILKVTNENHRDFV